MSGLQKDISDLVTFLNDDLKRVSGWCKSNGQMLNPSKTRAIVFQTCPPSNDLPKIVIENTEIDYSESLALVARVFRG